jgi:hypothetical protein
MSTGQPTHSIQDMEAGVAWLTFDQVWMGWEDCSDPCMDVAAIVDCELTHTHTYAY